MTNLLETVAKRAAIDVAKDALRLVSTDETASLQTYANRPSEVWCMATTDRVDDEGEVILPDGIDMEYLLKRGMVYIDHTYTVPNTVGKIRRMVRKAHGGRNGWESQVQILDANTPETQAIKALAAENMLSQSIAVQRLDSGRPDSGESAAYKGAQRITRKSRAIELSFTTWPMNPDCTMTGAKSRQRADHLRTVLKSAGLPEKTFDLFRVPKGTVYYIG